MEKANFRNWWILKISKHENYPILIIIRFSKLSHFLKQMLKMNKITKFKNFNYSKLSNFQKYQISKIVEFIKLPNRQN